MIVIVGTGPAGLALARELQRRGLAYRVLERGGFCWVVQWWATGPKKASARVTVAGPFLGTLTTFDT